MIPHDSANTAMQHQLAQERSDNFLARLIKSVTGPMVIAAGPVPGTREGRPGPRAIGDDPTLLEKTAHVRANRESMNQFYARIGLGPNQILAMSKDEISRFVEVATANETPKAPTGMYAQPAPQRFVLEA